MFTAFFGVFGWATGLAKLTDNSFFWHLRTGEYILDHGIPHHDVFSYTAPGTKWVAQSWLAEVTYALLDRSVGGFGIRLFVGLVGAGIGILTYRLALRLVRDRLVACGLTVAALAGIYTVWSERPLLVGVLFLLVLLWVVEVPESIVGRHPLVVIPVLMWLWANTHGTYAARLRVPRAAPRSAAGSTARRRGSGASAASSPAPRSRSRWCSSTRTASSW